MPPSRLVQWGAIGGLIAGAAWALSGIWAVGFPSADEAVASTPYYVYESAHAIAGVGMLAALVGLRVVHARSLSRLGVAGFAVAFVGTTLVLVATLWVLIFLDRLGGGLVQVLFGLGVLGWLVGFVLFGVATYRARVLPRWAGLLLVIYPLVLIVSFPFDETLILVGLLWLALGYVLWSRKGTVAEQPSRVA